MNPTTTADPRYSDPKAIAVSWDETRKLLEAAELFWICTVRPDGRPRQSQPVLTEIGEDGCLCR